MNSHSPESASVSRRFGRAAATYDDAARVQAEAARRLVAQLYDAPTPDRILDAGCGSGRLTRELAARFPRARITAMDVSGRMLESAARLHPAHLPVEWVQGDFQRFHPSEPFDLVASSSALHWAENLREAVSRCASHLAPGGRLAVSIMLEGTLRELHAARAAAAPDADPRAALPLLADLREAAHAAGVDVLRGGDYELTSHHAGAQPVLVALHAMGLTGGARFRPRRPLTRRELRQLCENYERESRAADGTIPATYRIGWVIASRPF
ncbi:MAG: methyltransferase domain-containing protein [Kiritimatiellae bacterium]|nr:methyltransferase domain-containing protein [Kiritimatiellia bacterium]